MKLTLILILVIVLTACAGEAFAQKRPIFRTVTLNDAKTISLGEEFSEKSDLFEKFGDQYRLKKGLFGGAEQIRVVLDKDLKINQIYFLYDGSKDFLESKKSYTKSLGNPSAEEERELTGGGKVRRVSWQDSETRFELVESRENGKVSVRSILFDK